MAVNDERKVAGAGEDTVQSSGDASTADLSFLDTSQSGIVDLDALFDALNIAAEKGGNTMEFVAGGPDGGGKLIISGADLTLEVIPAPADDMSHQTADLLKSGIVSDES